MPPQRVNASINTDSFITGYSRTGKARSIRHLRIDDDNSFVKIYRIGEVIGRGNFGTVYEVRDMKDDKLWASKVIIKKNVTSANMRALEREMSILKCLNHPHIIMLREVLESQSKIYLILEKCSSDLLRLVKECNKNFSESEVKRVIQDLASAVTYLHKNDIVHRDIKMENVLVTENPTDSEDHLFVKLSDFGLSIIKTGRGITSMLHERCGTLTYMSPEILSSGSYSQQCDVWAMGVIMYFLFMRTMPFEGMNEQDVIRRICNEEPNFDRSELPLEAKDLLARVLNKDPAERMTAAEMTLHPWLLNKQLLGSQRSNNVIDMMRQCNKDMRLSIHESPDDVLLLNRENGRSQAAVTVQNVMFPKNNKRTSSSTNLPRPHSSANNSMANKSPPKGSNSSRDRGRDSKQSASHQK